MNIINHYLLHQIWRRKNGKGFVSKALITLPTKKAFTYLKLSCKEAAKDKQLFFRRDPNEVLWFGKGVEDEAISSIATCYICLILKTTSVN